MHGSKTEQLVGIGNRYSLHDQRTCAVKMDDFQKMQIQLMYSFFLFEIYGAL